MTALRALPLQLNFGALATRVTSTGGRGPAGLRLAPARGRLAGPGKYGVLEHRRRQAQIRARHLLEILGSEPQPSGRDDSGPGQSALAATAPRL